MARIDRGQTRGMTNSAEILEALEAEEEQLHQLLGSLDESQWSAPSKCRGWSVTDVVLHLAQTEEAVVAGVNDEAIDIAHILAAKSVDEGMHQWVVSQRGDPAGEVLDRWNRARINALEALRSADPQEPLRWVAAPLKPATLATTRLSEHWIHAHDIADPLGLPYSDSDRLEHICWLAHRTLPFAFSAAGRALTQEVRLELTSASGRRWSFGSDDAPVVVRGSAEQFCRVAGRRLSPEEAPDLEGIGEGADEVLRLIRTYA
jgi:uncharacterized protein (TIGR03084 family)